MMTGKNTIMLSFIAAGAVLFFATAFNKKTAQLKGFAVVELFTSEGCSSCPAADEAIIRVAKDHPESVYILVTMLITGTI